MTVSLKTMRQATTPIVSLCAGIAIVLMVSGCSFFGKKEVTDDFVEAEPPDHLYNQGLAYLEAGNTRKAQEKFEEIDKEHPYSSYAKRSLIMNAYVSYKRGDYDTAITEAQRYVGLYPSSEDAAYAYYIMGESYFKQIPDVTRDQEISQKAMSAMNEVVRKYPESEYYDDAKRKIRIANDQLAGKEMQIGRYYEERQEYLAAINRFKSVVNDYQTTRHVEEALYRLVESYLGLGVTSEAQTAAAVLGHNFPNSQWYQDAYKALGGATPQENKKSWISRAFDRGSPET